MAYDAALPATGVTNKGILYEVLRNNFVALKAQVDLAYDPGTWIQVTSFVGDWHAEIPVYYRKDNCGFVYLKGTAHTVNGDNGPCFTLPYGYCPVQYIYFIARWISAAAPGLVMIDPNGLIQALYDGYSGSLAGNMLLLDQIHFSAA